MKKLGLLALFFCNVLYCNSQTPLLYGLLRTSTPASVQLGTLDLLTGNISTANPNSIASSINLTGAALDLNTNNYFFITQGGSNGTILTLGMNDGLIAAQQQVTNPLAPSYFDNFRFNTSDSTLYGLARRFIPAAGGQPGYGELFFASIDPGTGVVSQISQQSITDSYSISGNAIDPHQMIYYFSKSTVLYGIDMYNGQIYTSPTLSYPEGGMYFDNYTYNCADTSIYGIIRVTTTPPITAYLGKVNPTTGVVTRIAQTPLQYNTYSVNGSSTIDPNNGVYYFAAKSTAVIPAINVVVGVSLATGTVVFEQVMTLPGTAVNSRYFNLLRYPTDCAEAFPTRVNPNSGSAGLAAANKSTLKVAPNPFEQQFTVTSAELIEAITLRDAQGKVVLQQAASSNTLEVETGSLQSGVYFLEVQTASGVELVKVVK